MNWFFYVPPTEIAAQASRGGKDPDHFPALPRKQVNADAELWFPVKKLMNINIQAKKYELLEPFPLYKP